VGRAALQNGNREAAPEAYRVPEGNGTMLDNTLIVYMSCNGGDHHGG
jgi:hypothetical protein